jgi:hypothetical protein
MAIGAYIRSKITAEINDTLPIHIKKLKDEVVKNKVVNEMKKSYKEEVRRASENAFSSIHEDRELIDRIANKSVEAIEGIVNSEIYKQLKESKDMTSEFMRCLTDVQKKMQALERKVINIIE